MKLSDETVGRFKALWRERYHEELSDAEAQEYAGLLITLVQIVVEQPHPRGRGPPVTR